MLMNLYLYHRVSVVETTYQNLMQDSNQISKATQDIRAQLWMRNTYIRTYLLTGNAEYLQHSNEMKNKTDELVSGLEEKLQYPRADKEIGVLKLSLIEYDKTLKQGAEVREKLGLEGTLKFLAASGKRADGMEKMIDGFSQYIAGEIERQVRETQAEQVKANWIIVISNLIVLLLAVWISMLMARRIANPVADMAETAESVAEGDLRDRDFSYQGNDEIGDMSNSMEKMLKGLRGIITHVRSTSENVANASHQLNLVTEQSSQAAEDVAKTTTELAATAATQTNEMNAVLNVVSDMVNSIGLVAENTSKLAVRAERTSEVAKDGRVAVTKVGTQMQTINTSVNESAQGVKALGDSSAQIGNIVQVISDIAGQTNLLALNAAIEAARAGENGRGFAVVAGEVKKLADQSQQAAQSIAQLIEAIQAKIETVVAMMEKGSRDVEDGTNEMTVTLEKFNHITELIQELDGQINDITHATNDVSESGARVLSSIDSVKQMVENTVSGTHSISAATEEQLSSMEEISSASGLLAKQAKELENMMMKFKV